MISWNYTVSIAMHAWPDSIIYLRSVGYEHYNGIF